MKTQLTLTLLLFCPLWAFSASVYYVDFEKGNDHAAGTSPAAAFQCAPGDPEATSRAAAVRLRPGDRVIFKGGVVYRGQIRIEHSGRSGEPIVFDGNAGGAYGTGRAILDGSTRVGNWRPCRSAEDCGGNPNWKHIYTTVVDAKPGIDAFRAGLVQGGNMLFPAQFPKPDDPFYDCNSTHFLSPETTPTLTTLKDERLAEIGDSLLGAYIIQITVSSFASYSPITAWDESTSTVTFKKSNRQPIGRYSIVNALSGTVFTRPGEYVFHEESGTEGLYRIYLWPWEGEDPASAEVDMITRDVAIDLGETGLRHLIMEGFRIQNYGQAIRGRNTRYLAIRNNEITHIRTTDSTSAVHFVEVRDHLVEGNHIHHCQRSNAIQTVHGENVIYRGNTIRMVGRSPLRFYHIKKGQMVDNIVLDCRGIHSNPFTIYVECEDILVARNVAQNSNIGLTLNNTQRVYVINNIFTAGDASTIGLWPGGLTKDHVFLNNFIGLSDSAFFVNDPNVEGLVMKNNIIGGVAGFPLDESNRRSHNMYLSPRADYAEGEFRSKGLDALFLDPNRFDFRPHPESPSIDRGTDVSSLYPRETFPEFDFDSDFAGNPRVQGEAIDIGPFEAAPREFEGVKKQALPSGLAAAPPRSVDQLSPRTDIPVKIIPATGFTAEGGGSVDVFKPGDDSSDAGYIRYWSTPGHWLEWIVEDVAPGLYKLEFRYATLAYAPRRIDLNGVMVPDLEEVVLPRSSGWRNFVEGSAPAPLDLTAGTNVLRLTSLGGIGLNIEEMRLIPVR